MEEALKSYVDPTAHSVDVNPPLSSALQEQAHEKSSRDDRRWSLNRFGMESNSYQLLAFHCSNLI